MLKTILTSKLLCFYIKKKSRSTKIRNLEKSLTRYLTFTKIYKITFKV